MDARSAAAMVIGMGLYQGCNPSMAWLPAVALGIRNKSALSLVGTAGRMVCGHYLAMISSLIPLAILIAFGITRADGLMTFLGVMLGLFGAFKLSRQRHPIILARIHPDQLTKWAYINSFLHCGAPLMVLMPFIVLVMPFEHLCSTGWGKKAIAILVFGIPALEISVLFVVSTAIALVVWRVLGLKSLTRVWVNFDFGMSAISFLMAYMALSMPGTSMDMYPIFG